MERLLIVIALGVGLTGCQVRGTSERFMSDAEVDAKDDGVCRSYGAAAGTPTYVQCRLSLRSNRSSEDSMRRFSP